MYIVEYDLFKSKNRETQYVKNEEICFSIFVIFVRLSKLPDDSMIKSFIYSLRVQRKHEHKDTVSCLKSKYTLR